MDRQLATAATRQVVGLGITAAAKPVVAAIKLVVTVVGLAVVV